MRLSKKKQQELYNCIHDNITNLRIKLLDIDKAVGAKVNSADLHLAQLEHPIWRDIKKVLNIIE